MAALVTIEAVAICLLGLLVAGLLRSHADILRQLHDLGAGDRSATTRVGAPGRLQLPTGSVDGADIAGENPVGEPVAVGIVGSRTPTLLAFLSSTCITCTRFWDAFATDDGRRLPGAQRVVIVSRSADEDSPAALARRAPKGVTVVLSSRAWEDYGVPASPYFVLVGGDGRIRGEGTASTHAELRSLLESAIDDEASEGGERRADDDLTSAGIVPGDPRLYPPTGATGARPGS